MFLSVKATFDSKRLYLALASLPLSYPCNKFQKYSPKWWWKMVMNPMGSIPCSNFLPNKMKLVEILKSEIFLRKPTATRDVTEHSELMSYSFLSPHLRSNKKHSQRLLCFATSFQNTQHFHTPKIHQSSRQIFQILHLQTKATNRPTPHLCLQVTLVSKVTVKSRVK